MCPSQRDIDIFTILDSGPNLKTVEIVLTRDYDTAGIVQGSGAGATIEPGRQKHYPLEQLTIDGPMMDLKTTEQIILSCPALRVLKFFLIADNWDGWGTGMWDLSVIPEAGERLACLARDRCPNLQWYHADLGLDLYRLPAMST